MFVVKKLFYIVLCLLLFVSCSKSNFFQKRATKAHIEFNETQHNFGKVIFSHPVEHNFVFTNTGKDTLKISEVQSQCGCTVTNWSRKDIAPSDTSSIKVTFNAQRSGEFQKSVTVFSNADNSMVMLYIYGEVTPNPNKIIIGGKTTKSSGDSLQQATKYKLDSNVEFKEE